MPELPEVEILVRHLAPLLKRRTIRSVDVRRARSIAPSSADKFGGALEGASFKSVTRRGKYLVFTLRDAGSGGSMILLGHLGMTGRMYLRAGNKPLPKHAAVVVKLDRGELVFEDTRYFGRLTLDVSALERLGPEPLGPEFTADYLFSRLKGSSQAIKTKLLDQGLVAGVGNIYASEALFRAGISPRLTGKRLRREQAERLWRAIREVLEGAIAAGSKIPLDFAGIGGRDGLFYYGSEGGDSGFYEERFRVYDRAGKACPRCSTPIRRLVQGARSTFYCPRCQRG